MQVVGKPEKGCCREFNQNEDKYPYQNPYFDLYYPYVRPGAPAPCYSCPPKSQGLPPVPSSGDVIGPDDEQDNPTEYQQTTMPKDPTDPKASPIPEGDTIGPDDQQLPHSSIPADPKEEKASPKSGSKGGVEQDSAVLTNAIGMDPSQFQTNPNSDALDGNDLFPLSTDSDSQGQILDLPTGSNGKAQLQASGNIENNCNAIDCVSSFALDSNPDPNIGDELETA